MNILEAVANWYGCPYDEGKNCRDGCKNYMMVDPRRDLKKGVGPGPKEQRTLCNLLSDLDDQIQGKTKNPDLSA